MARIDIEYGGHLYCVGGRELTELIDEIADGIRHGTHWLRVNDGDGTRRDALLLISPGVPIAVIPVPKAEDHWDEVEEYVHSFA